MHKHYSGICCCCCHGTSFSFTAQPIHELIDGPAFPLLLDEDQNPDEIKTALLMVSHTQKVQENNIGNFAPALKLHLEPPTTPPQVEGASNPSPLASNQQHALYPPLTQLASSPVQQGPLTGDNQLLSSLQEMSVCQLATRPFGSTSVRRRSHSWLLPGDAKHCHGHKRANSSSSSSNEVYHPHSLSMKKSRHLSESLSYSQMEPTAERIMDSSGGQYFGGGHRFAPRAMTLSPRPPSRPHPSTIYPAQAKGAR